jgi:hypothetical protein
MRSALPHLARLSLPGARAPRQVFVQQSGANANQFMDHIIDPFCPKSLN